MTKIHNPITNQYLKSLNPPAWTRDKNAAKNLTDSEVDQFLSQGGPMVNSCQMEDAAA